MNTKLLNLAVYTHNGKNEFSMDQVKAIETPEPQGRWYPISHSHLVETFKKQIEESGLEILAESMTLARHGLRFFGLFQIGGISSPNSNIIGTVIGLRNSHDKSFPAGMCAGCAPFVCTNLAFSNEIVLGRKHTTNILRDLPQLVSRGIGKLTTHWTNQDKRIETYQNYSLDDMEAHDIIVRAYRSGAIGKTHIADVAEQWHNPEHDDFAARNGWSLYNGFTNVLRGNITALNNRSDALHGVLDPAFGLNAINV